MKYSCLIADDEPYAIEIIENYTQQIKSLELVGKCKNALEVSNILLQGKVDILFLDIEMPLLNGVDLIKSLNIKPQIILITAYREYAIDSYELEVTEYLLKPVSFARFNKAVNKAISFINLSRQTGKVNDKEQIIFKVDKKLISVRLNEILYIESLKDYVRVKTLNESLVVYQTMGSLEEILPKGDFCRIHKSYIIAINKIRSIEGNMVEVGSKKILISRHYKEEALGLIFSRNISGLK